MHRTNTNPHPHPTPRSRETLSSLGPPEKKSRSAHEIQSKKSLIIDIYTLFSFRIILQTQLVPQQYIIGVIIYMYVHDGRLNYVCMGAYHAEVAQSNAKLFADTCLIYRTLGRSINDTVHFQEDLEPDLEKWEKKL